MENFISNYANIPNPITKFFNKIESFKLDGDHSKNIDRLEAMKKVPLYVKSISISSNNEEQLENLTDPNFHNTPISKLKLKLLDIFEISAKTIENLKAIYPNSITLEVDSYLFCKDETEHQALFKNFTKLLLNVDQTPLEMKFNEYDYKFKLEFNNAICKVVESKEECSYIRAKLIKIRCRAEELYWIKTGDLNMSVLDSYYLYLNKSGYINISEFIRIKDQKEIKEVEKMFSDQSSSKINKGIIIPMKYSNKIYITIIDCNSNLFDNENEEENQKAIKVIPHIKDIEYKWNFGSNYNLVSKYLSLLPARTKYSLDMDNLDLIKVPDLDEKLRMLNWNDKRIDSIHCMSLQQINIF